MTTIKELKELNAEEQQLFAAIEQENAAEVQKLLLKRNGQTIRVNCLDQNGMSPLDQASFRGNEELVPLLLAHGANADNRAHDQGYTALMFAALAGKPRLCQLLLDAGADAQAVNGIGKTATELAAFVGQHECVSVISNYISRQDVDRILNPRGSANSDEPNKYPPALVQFIHQLTRTHAFHPVRLVMDVVDNGLYWAHCKKVIWTVDRLFERQLRSKQPNEVLSVKLWLILHTLRELLKFVEERMVGKKHGGEREECTSSSAPAAKEDQGQEDEEAKLARLFARTLLVDRPELLVRQNEERFIRQAVAAFPYKQWMLWQALSKQFAQIPFGSPPPAFIVLCHTLAGPRFVQTAHFCRCCYGPSAQKRCQNCKLFYCSTECQRFDWPIHKKCCEQLKRRQQEEQAEKAEAKGMELFGDDELIIDSNANKADADNANADSVKSGTSAHQDKDPK